MVVMFQARRLVQLAGLAACAGCYTYAPSSPSGTPSAGTTPPPDSTTAPPPDTRCFIVYVHGMGPNLSPDVATDDDRRAYWQPTRGSTLGDLVYVSSRQNDSVRACVTLVTGYDGGAAFFDDVAAGAVARQIAQFATDQNVPDGRIVLIGHSMGGLVIRWILNRAADANPDFATVIQKTRYAITIASPHLGSPAADAQYGMSGTACGDFIAGWLELTGQVPATRAAASLTRAYLEEGSAVGGWMGDAYRTRTIYTIGTTGWNRDMTTSDDWKLDQAWPCLGMSDTPGDGLVTGSSGLGLYQRSGTNDGFAWHTGDRIGGPFAEWAVVNLNHNHARYSDETAMVYDPAVGGHMDMLLGVYIAQNGLDLEP